MIVEKYERVIIKFVNELFSIIKYDPTQNSILELIEKINGKYIFNNKQLENVICYKKNDEFILSIKDKSLSIETYFDIAYNIANIFFYGYILEPEKWDLLNNDKILINKKYLIQIGFFTKCILLPTSIFYEEIKNCYIGNNCYQIDSLVNKFNTNIDDIHYWGIKLDILR